jgi:hypothetical protein
MLCVCVSKSGTLFYWLVLVFVALAFVSTVVFMRLTPKINNST